ncbi:tetratricopeptide repeat-containing sulfotransferase family protein [Pseudophaeobacter flagellatus]|uniref:tetratricopeptide repeat-containing sulfotransferase family protein n=1 Tax=Pseudophaeobacter flagellatus TaxID=2899119 RepID=UPI001E3C69D4|nr:sulfotransferase [Pseudophaeobacter flagellatus]MCD9148731.1 sulfotransferase [Pseudophaeobacter flagellatus]
MNKQKYQEVLITLQPLIAAGQADAAMLDLVAECYFGLGRADRGLAVLEAIVETWPENLPIWGKLGSLSLQNGDSSRAAEAFKEILVQEPDSATALSALYVAEPFAWDSDYAARLRDLFTNAKLPEAGRAGAINTLGKAAAAADQTKMAMFYYEAANMATPGDYDPSATSASVAQQCSYFDPAQLPQLPGPAINTDKGAGTQPLFIVGLPRSGTTLVENMLLAHSDVSSIGESPVLIQTRKVVQLQLSQQTQRGPKLVKTDDTIAKNNKLQQNRDQSWDWCTQTSPELAQRARNAYLAQYPQNNMSSRIIIDKLPQNLFEMGFARMILPEARFVFMMRHPLDVGLSLFTTNFHQGHAYSKRLDWIGKHIRTNYDSLDDYIPKLGDRLRVQSYRQLVENPEPQMRALVAHLGLNWDPACLTPLNNKSLVKTASVTQVRKGLNQSGLGKWTRFERELTPLIKALGGWDWIKEWEARDATL